ncbi:hypothetical protein J6497_37040 [Bradyrhizobium sp. CNPSo 4026]|nr:hypothetical protein [Bradyrhizobium cenepequi]
MMRNMRGESTSVRVARIKAACVAQLVNVIRAHHDGNRGRCWRQPIFYPFQHAARWARGSVLDMRLTCGTFVAGDGEHFPDLVSTAYWPRTEGALPCFASTGISTTPSIPRSICAASNSAASSKATS